MWRPSSRHGNLDDVQTRPRAGPRDGSSFHQAAGQPPDVAQPHGLIVQLLDAHVDAGVMRGVQLPRPRADHVGRGGVRLGDRPPAAAAA